jgi:putative N6-adenine-specific DNA methylase
MRRTSRGPKSPKDTPVSGPRPRRAPAARTPPTRSFAAFAAIAPGLEDALCAELVELGFEPERRNGGADLVVDVDGLCRLHRYSRIAGRVTVTLGKASLSSLDGLASGVRQYPWVDFVRPGQAVAVKVTVTRSGMRRREAVGSKVQNAIADALRGPRRNEGPRPPREPFTALLRIEDDKAYVGADASGELLHRRGWRLATAKAPLRENLAAAVLRVAGWTGNEPLVDPMCGAGTFAIEAAGYALGHGPGAKREFAFLHWPCVDRGRWNAMGDLPARGHPVIIAADREQGAIDATVANAKRAGVTQAIRVVRADIASLEPPAGPGLIVINPPYGHRIGGTDAAGAYRAIGNALREGWKGWRLAILVADRKYLAPLGLHVEPVTRFSNGGIKVGVFVGVI